MGLVGRRCKAMEGLVGEARETLKRKGEPALIDAALIAALQCIERCEMSAYGTARDLAEQLGRHEAALMLQQALDEESAADEKLALLARGGLFSVSIEPAQAEPPTALETLACAATAGQADSQACAES
jgi:ferritin-like metal-binding protein YciE